MNLVMNAYGDLNPYALDYPVCTGSAGSKAGHAQRLWQMNHQLKLANIDPKAVGVQSTTDYEPCEDNYALAYLNQKSVKAAIHVSTSTVWEECSYKVSYNSTDSGSVSTAPIYNYLIDGKFGLNLLVYSGDDDSICATIGTQEWIWDLGYTPAANMWGTYTVNDQTAGYLTQWTNTKLGFLTIHGAGHEVPTYKPGKSFFFFYIRANLMISHCCLTEEVALDMWKRYLAGEFTSK
jgi:hypothetical protein